MFLYAKAFNISMALAEFCALLIGCQAIVHQSPATKLRKRRRNIAAFAFILRVIHKLNQILRTSRDHLMK